MDAPDCLDVLAEILSFYELIERRAEEYGITRDSIKSDRGNLLHHRARCPQAQ